MKNITKLCLFVMFLVPNIAGASFIKIEGLYEDSKAWYQWKEFKIGQNISYWALEIIQPKNVEAAEPTLEEQIKQWIITVSQQYKIDSGDMLNLAYCESQFNPKDKGDYRSETNTYMARGLYQFWKNTFDVQSEKYNFKGDYLNWKDQTILAAKMLKEKEGWKHWFNCWKFIHQK